MKKKERAEVISSKLNEIYPKPKVPLYHTNNFTLLIAVVLSAQCTDKKVNQVTPVLFHEGTSPKHLKALGESGIYEIIKSLGLSRQKSKNIFNLSDILLEQFSGLVPSNFEDLESLPGVGHKTSSVVMSQAFGIPTFPVDTHIHRLAQRWELSSGKNVMQTERDLKSLFPIESWNKLHLQIIFYGREHCTARSCHGLECNLCKELFPHRKIPIKHIKA